MKKLGIYGQYIQDGSLEVVKTLLDFFEHRDCDIAIEMEYHQMLRDNNVAQNIKSFSKLDESYDGLISIGGDGTILRAVAFVGSSDIPVI